MKKWTIYICADCGNDMAAFAGEHVMVDMTEWACRCGGSNFIECTDLKLVPVGEHCANKPHCDCDMIGNTLQKQNAEVDKSCEGCDCYYDRKDYLPCKKGKEWMDNCISDGYAEFTPKPEPQEQQDLKLKRLCGEERISKIHTQLLTMIIDQQQQIDAINTRLDRLFEVNRNAAALLEANLNDSEAGTKMRIELLRKHIGIEKRRKRR